MEPLPFLTAAIGAAVTFLIARRKASGRVAVTEADRLWEEAERIRRAMRKQQLESDATIFELRAENHQLRGEIMRLRFSLNPDIPEDIRKEELARQQRHVDELLRRADERRREALNGNGRIE